MPLVTSQLVLYRGSISIARPPGFSPLMGGGGKYPSCESAKHAAFYCLAAFETFANTHYEGICHFVVYVKKMPKWL